MMEWDGRLSVHSIVVFKAKFKVLSDKKISYTYRHYTERWANGFQDWI